MRSTDPNSAIVWQIQVPVGSGFAELLVLHDQQPQAPVVCEVCGRRSDSGPLRVEWDQGSDAIADFTFARGHIVIKEQVADQLALRCSGFRKGPVEMPDHPNLHRPSGPRARRKRQVWLPYEGQALCELLVTHEVDMRSESTAVVEHICHACGRIIYAAFNGIERKNSRGRTPRESGKGLFFTAASIEGDAEIFRPRFTGLTLCTTKVKEYIEQQGYTNVEFLEVGELV